MLPRTEGDDESGDPVSGLAPEPCEGTSLAERLALSRGAPIHDYIILPFITDLGL